MKQFFYRLILFSFFMVHADHIVSYSYPYNQLTQLLPYNDNDICFDELWIQKLFKHNTITNVVEIGAGLGASTAIFAKLLPAEGVMYVLNSWYGFMPYLDIDSCCSDGEYQQFLSNMIHLGLQSKVIPIKIKPLINHFYSFVYVKEITRPIQLAYVHSTECAVVQLRTVASAYGLVDKKRGILCGNDWHLDFVKTAVITFAQKVNVTVYASDNFWFIKQENNFAVKSFSNNDTCWYVIA